jgi:two-component system, OmpR family, phosphate regulon response regulator OmpR
METKNPSKILVVDDDPRLRDLLRRYLGEQGFNVYVAENAPSMNKLWVRERFDLLVLDLMLPGEDGLSICRRLRGSNDRTPIIMLTAKGEDVDRIVGLEMGADDYLPKPFDPLELVARINAVLRRSNESQLDIPIDPILAVGDVEMDNRTRTVHRAGEIVELTVVEYSLLEQLLSAPGQILAREDLVKKVLHRKLSPFDRSIDTHVSNLRKKLGHEVNGTERIKTVRSIGYIYASPKRAGSE